MKRTLSLPELFQQAYDDAVAAHVPVVPKDQIYVLYNREKMGRAWGRVSPMRDSKYTYMLELSKRLCNYTDDRSIKNTMIHELIHCAGAYQHGATFKKYAALVNAKYPDYYHVSRCTSESEKMDDKTILKTSKYAIACPRCGCVYGRERLTRSVRNPGNYYCPRCAKNSFAIKLVRVK